MAGIADTLYKPLTLFYLNGHISSENLKFSQRKKEQVSAAEFRGQKYLLLVL